MKTGLTKRRKAIRICFGEQNPIIDIPTHDTSVKHRLKKLMQTYPGLCCQTDDDKQDRLTFETDKARFSLRLTAPYSEKRRETTS
jgi:hypothetical protein